jgi:hypothetical protein
VATEGLRHDDRLLPADDRLLPPVVSGAEKDALGVLREVAEAVRRIEQKLDAAAPAQANASEWLAARQAAEFLGMSLPALYAAVARGGPLAKAASRLGRRLRFHRDGLTKLLKSGTRRRTTTARVPSPPTG